MCVKFLKEVIRREKEIFNKLLSCSNLIARLRFLFIYVI